MSTLANMKNVSAEDRKMIQDAETMFGPEPTDMGFAKNMFWGRFREDLIFPYPRQTREEDAKSEALLAVLDDYLKNEHPSIQIDQEEEIPQWAIDRLFEIGVMGMTVPEEYGGLGLGITSYNKVLARIGESCASTAVVVSAHQSIGCKAIMLFGNEEQKAKWLPMVAREKLSGFCLSEPQVGCDAGGQETWSTLSDDGEYYTINGEKKWTTSGAYSGMFTVMTKQSVVNPKTGKSKEGVTALICTPDMEGIEVFESNRSKCGIRGTWQARIRFTNVRVPKKNLLHKEGRGLHVALTCLNYGRCTLSAGVFGAAKRSMHQATKWAQTRYQFDRPIGEFELVEQKIARMSAYVYAMDAVLYMMTGMLDRHDGDIMVETAMTKVMASELGWLVIDDAMQIMGGDGYMTENELERAFRDARIYRVVEGANEVMHSFIFAYGAKQLAENLINVQDALLWDKEESPMDNIRRMLTNGLNPTVMQRAIPLGIELFLRVKPAAPIIASVHPALQNMANRLAKLIQKHSHNFKLESMRHEEKIVTRQVAQARLSQNAINLFAMSCVLSKLDNQLRSGASGIEFEADRASAIHYFDLAELEIRENERGMKKNADESMRTAAAAAKRFNDTLPNSDFYIHKTSPNAKGTGKVPNQTHIRQFPIDPSVTPANTSGDGAASAAPKARKAKASK